jgi:TolA-binding protein
MKQRFVPNIDKFRWSIKYIWLIIAALSMANMLSSCSSTKSIRNGKKDFAKKSQSNNDIQLEEKYNQIKNSSVVEKEDNEEKDIEVASIKDFADKISSKNSSNAVAQNNTETNGRKIPTLREQMKLLADAQTVIKGQINTLQNDVTEIKESLKSFKKEIIEAKPKEKPTNIVFAKASSIDIINSDEAEDSNEQAAIESPKKKDVEKKAVKAPATKKIKKATKKQVTQTVSKDENVKAKDTKKMAKPVVAKQPEKPAISQNTAKETSSNVNNYELALKSFQAHDYSKAIELLNKNLASENNPTKVIDTYYWLGESYYGLKKYDQAVENLNKVIKQKSHSKQSNAQILVAECLTKKGDYAEAKKAFQSFISKYPQSDYVPRAKKMIQQL